MDVWFQPTPPGEPIIENWGADFCDLRYTKPLSDGGAPIQHYNIEIKDKYNSEWLKIK